MSADEPPIDWETAWDNTKPCPHGVGSNGLGCWKCRDDEHDRKVEAETARKIAEWIRPRGFIGSTVTADLIERMEWKKP